MQHAARGPKRVDPPRASIAIAKAVFWRNNLQKDSCYKKVVSQKSRTLRKRETTIKAHLAEVALRTKCFLSFALLIGNFHPIGYLHGICYCTNIQFCPRSMYQKRIRFYDEVVQNNFIINLAHNRLRNNRRI